MYTSTMFQAARCFRLISDVNIFSLTLSCLINLEWITLFSSSTTVWPIYRELMPNTTNLHEFIYVGRRGGQGDWVSMALIQSACSVGPGRSVRYELQIWCCLRWYQFPWVHSLYVNISLCLTSIWYSKQILFIWQLPAKGEPTTSAGAEPKEKLSLPTMEK